MSTNPLVRYPANIRIQLIREKRPPRVQMKCPEDVDNLMGDYLRSLDRESLFAMYLDAQNRVLGIEEVSRGTLNSALINPRDIIKSALLIAANSVIVVHNHPSGATEPSPEDRSITFRIQEACRLFNIELLDHVIIGDGFHSILHN